MGTAVILTKGYFNKDRAKTAHGLIRHGRRYDILAVVDSMAAADAAGFLGVEYPHPVPIVLELKDAPPADTLIVGVAPPGGRLPPDWREDIVYALSHGMNVVSGLHDFLGDDPEFAEVARRNGTEIWDVRRPPPDLECATGRLEVRCPVVLTVGTEAAIGKRTTALGLVRAAEEAGIDAAFLATGQSGIMIGCDEGIVADRLPGDFISGEIEKRVRRLTEGGKQLIVVEGNGSLSHPAYGPVALGILTGSHATHLIMCHDPDMRKRGSFSEHDMPTIDEEMGLIGRFSRAPLLGIALRTRQSGDWEAVVGEYAKRYKVPVVDPVRQGTAPFLSALGFR